MDRKHAEAIARAVSRLDASELATKQDLAELKSEQVMVIGLTVGLTVALIKLLPG